MSNCESGTDNVTRSHLQAAAGEASRNNLFAAELTVSRVWSIIQVLPASWLSSPTPQLEKVRIPAQFSILLWSYHWYAANAAR